MGNFSDPLNFFIIIYQQSLLFTKFDLMKVILHTLQNLDDNKIKCFGFSYSKMGITILSFAWDLCGDSIK